MMARRTTVTLEDDVLEQLTAHVRHTGRPLRKVLNDAIRRGLDRPRAPAAPFRIEARDLGAQPGIGFDDISALLELAEGPAFR
jgi:ribbon-helix-helix CopG family protein